MKALDKIGGGMGSGSGRRSVAGESHQVEESIGGVYGVAATIAHQSMLFDTFGVDGVQTAHDEGFGEFGHGDG
ncbi:MAG: hypothetical protein ABI165_19330 [Bryobacteraceae bacterium]